LDGISKTIQKSTLTPFPLEPFRHRRFPIQSIQSINLTKQSHFSFRVVAKVNNYLTMVHPNTRASGRQAEDEDLDNQRPSGRPQRTVKAPQVFTFSSPNNNDSSSPSKPSTKKKRKKRKKPSERTAQENLEAMRESRARNLPPSSDEDDDLHKNPSALDLGVFTQYSADQDDVSDGDGGDSSPSNGSSGSAVNANNILASNQDTSSSNNSHGSDAQGNDDDSAARDDIDGQGPVVFEAVAGRNCDSQRSNWFWNALSVGNTQEVASILIDVKQERFENGEYVPPVDPRQYQQQQWQNNNIPPVHGLTDSDTAAAMVQDPSLLPPPPPLPTLNQQANDLDPTAIELESRVTHRSYRSL
jgi:type II secretory pathway pseudopilin PulG